MEAARLTFTPCALLARTPPTLLASHPAKAMQRPFFFFLSNLPPPPPRSCATVMRTAQHPLPLPSPSASTIAYFHAPNPLLGTCHPHCRRRRRSVSQCREARRRERGPHRAHPGPAMSEVKTEESAATLEKRAAETKAVSKRAAASVASTGSEAKRAGVHGSISSQTLLFVF